MTGQRVLVGIMVVHLLAQALMGGVGFAFFPEGVLGGPASPEAALGFRLAGCTNLCGAGLGAALVARGVAVRDVAWASLAYHALAAASAAQVVVAGGPLAAVGASAGPFHAVFVALLAVGLVLGRRPRHEDRRPG